MGQFWRSENRLLPQPFSWQICFLDNTTPDRTRSGSWMESPIHNSSQETICWFSIFSRRWWGLFSTPDWSRTDRQEQDHFGSLRKQCLKCIIDGRPDKIFMAHVGSDNADPPFPEEILLPFRQDLEQFLRQHGHDPDWRIRNHQRMFLGILAAF